jgi:hypothetical protein
MTYQTTIAENTGSFKEFLLHNKQNRITLWLALIAIIIQFSIFKYFYPYASYIHGDSFVYLDTAYKNLDINTYMVGYSRFLRLFSVFSRTDLGLTAFQYLLIQSSALFLLFTLFYFYKPGKIVQIILLCFMVFNPLFLHLGNLVSSDGFFLALSLTWVTLLLWIIHKPNNYITLFHGIVLFTAFTVRYNALIYPFISAGVFFLSRMPMRRKLFGAAFGAVLCGLFVIYTGNKYKELTGTWQYSPFSGWQLANNAMYAYRYVEPFNRKPVTKKFQELDKTITTFFDSTRDHKKYPTESVMAGTFYMWSHGMPLFKYRDNLFKKDSSAKELKKWSSMGPFYKEYGVYMIKKYPIYFLKYFIWPNALKYYSPPVEFLETYNSGKDSVMSICQLWFRYTNLKLTTRTVDNKVHILDFYPILTGIINVVMLCCLICFLLLKAWRHNRMFGYGVLIGGTIWTLNAGFTIFASSAALRFQSFPILLTTSFALLLIDFIAQVANSKNEFTIAPIHPAEVKEYTENVFI